MLHLVPCSFSQSQRFSQNAFSQNPMGYAKPVIYVLRQASGRTITNCVINVNQMRSRMESTVLFTFSAQKHVCALRCKYKDKFAGLQQTRNYAHSQGGFYLSDAENVHFFLSMLTNRFTLFILDAMHCFNWQRPAGPAVNPSGCQCTLKPPQPARFHPLPSRTYRHLTPDT